MLVYNLVVLSCLMFCLRWRTVQAYSRVGIIIMMIKNMLSPANIKTNIGSMARSIDMNKDGRYVATSFHCVQIKPKFLCCYLVILSDPQED